LCGAANEKLQKREKDREKGAPGSAVFFFAEKAMDGKSSSTPLWFTSSDVRGRGLGSRIINPWIRSTVRSRELSKVALDSAARERTQQLLLDGMSKPRKQSLCRSSSQERLEHKVNEQPRVEVDLRHFYRCGYMSSLLWVFY
jgi:hypothetical protein